jgi:hypothetical protein
MPLAIPLLKISVQLRAARIGQLLFVPLLLFLDNLLNGTFFSHVVSFED